MKTVMTFGTFDILHPGHLDFLKQAKRYGDKLMVVIALDDTVKMVKGKLPKDNQKTRLHNVAEVESVDSAMFGNKGDKYNIIREYKPDIICLGYDQTTFTKNLKKEFPNIEFHTLKAFQPDKYKSSKINPHS